ncbi:hypothetical protein [Mangrovimonas aestuarii]|uniref:hypothetical protein n=1 Tax=Mangrovimonas aestuarii TaxID=3018443 RepID=UPI002379042E|nr:hypothetical protein [Mangrovimonas aestuarii]
MEPFLDKYYDFITFSVELIALVAGILAFKKFKDTAVKYFIYFLGYILLVEIVGRYKNYISFWPINYLEDTRFEENWWWYTLSWKIGAILFYAYYYQKIIRSKKFSSFLKYTSVAFLVVSLGVILIQWEDFFKGYFALINVMGMIVIFLCIVFYFTEMLRSDKVLTFYKSFSFYFSSALLIWWLINTPLVIYSSYYATVSDIEYKNLRKLILLFCNIFMYITFTFAFIWCNPKTE